MAEISSLLGLITDDNTRQALIAQMNAERRTLQYRMRGLIPPEQLTKKQRQIWEYMRLYPEETNYSAIAKGANVTRHTVAKHYGMIREMLGIKEPAAPA